MISQGVRTPRRDILHRQQLQATGEESGKQSMYVLMLAYIHHPKPRHTYRTDPAGARQRDRAHPLSSLPQTLGSGSVHLFYQGDWPGVRVSALL